MRMESTFFFSCCCRRCHCRHHRLYKIQLNIHLYLFSSNSRHSNPNTSSPIFIFFNIILLSNVNNLIFSTWLIQSSQSIHIGVNKFQFIWVSWDDWNIMSGKNEVVDIWLKKCGWRRWRWGVRILVSILWRK